MQIFLSHSSKQKPLIRELRNHLPEHLISWIDEEKLLFGDHVSVTIESVIKVDTDYVLVFVDNQAVVSSWVIKELEWALQAEKIHKRTILLPIVLDEDAFFKIGNVEIQNRKHLHLKDYQESSVRFLAAAITSQLFALLCRDVQSLRNPTNAFAAIGNADTLLRAHANLIQKAIFPHRKSNPISRERLLDVLNSHMEQRININEFELIMTAAAQRNLVAGLVYDGYAAFLSEEHASWKAEVRHEAKERIGRKAASYISNGSKIFIDAGSTTEEIVKVICKKIENRALTKITIATTSVNIADIVSDCCVKMGFDDDFSAVRLYVPGGQVRPNTQAIVPAEEGGAHQILYLSKVVGVFDTCFIGVNGVDMNAGFTTHANPEALNKLDILSVSKAKIIVGDSSKIGISLESKFADFSDDFMFIVDNDGENCQLKELIKILGDKIVLA